MYTFTKKAITDSFVKLLNDRPLDKIKVKDIVEDCGINRNTFYYYYQDIYALLSEVFQNETEQALKDAADLETFREAMLACMQFIRDNRRAVYHVYKSINRAQLEAYLHTVAEDRMLRLVRQLAKGLQVEEADMRLLAQFYQYAVVGMLLDWIENNLRWDDEQIIQRLSLMLEGNIRLSLEKVAK